MLAFSTELGTCGVRWGAAGITEVLMPGRRELDGVDVTAPADAPAEVRDAVEAMVALLAGEPLDLGAIALDHGDLDPFRRSVSEATRRIPHGTVATYGEIARAIGTPDAARAVGAALGSNPFPIIVPCHRVIAADGSLTGFSAPGGIATKRRMLEIENVPGFAQAALFV